VPSDEGTHRLLSEEVRLVDESRALNYALSMTLASAPRETLSREEIDTLCQLAFEIHTKLTQALELFKGLNGELSDLD
jgi:hypothetical protein